ncbi:helix-turn-helix transcriptional regulator [Actinomadura kijaniata]|uniref:Transcriptional regulator with XRE-family HTH domain n=1 Tax=Actinomadura namibiensis TaxID=182080 RepID=A0A7W3LRH0_ACTNM|nr:helix-turn-helix transcriptional regulator [Actinomadura namibiensis]MBA8952925.1 transcriptional regulator with XRE-family HTH domain [Actinomadura namibiensis]
MPRNKPAPTVRQRRLAGELLQLRADAGQTREEVAESTGINPATLYRIEHARTRPQTRTLVALLDAYGVTEPRRSELVTLNKQAAERGWLHTLASSLPEHYASYIEFEGAARAVRNYECLFIPGLCQTEDYARAAIRGTLPGATREQIQNRVEARMRRQAILTGEHPLELWAIVDEAALRRAVGGSQIMVEQMQKLREVSELPNVTLQVIPYEAGAHPGMPGSFVVMDFPESVGPSIVYIESQAGDLFLEEEADIQRYNLVFEHLRAAAISPDASASLVAKVAEEHQHPGRRA